MLRRAAVASSSAAALAVGAASVDDDARRSLTMGTVGAVCRTFMRGQGALTVHDEHHLRAGLARPAGVAMLSVSNHIATVDDPHLLASIVPPSTLVRPGAMRWGVCAHDVCFRPGSLLQRWADSAQVLPVRRGGGVWQLELESVIAKLRGGGWVHYFPEGTIRQDGAVRQFRRGVGRLVAAIREPADLRVQPFYHTGCEVLQPTTPTSQSIFSRPNLGTHIHVIFGPPLDLSPLLALRGEPPFDTRPELLYEVIAHTLEAEVRRLKHELERRIGQES